MSFTGFTQTVEEVTVTATRKAESLQDIALSVQAIGSAELETSHIETSRDLAESIPGISFTSGTGAGSVTRMRGLVMPAITAASIDANQTMINGHTIPNTSFGEMGFFDAERIEILNGPQGTLYGRNAITGIINLVTKRPGAGNYVNFSLGENGYGLVKAGVDFPLTDNLSGRLAVNSLTIDGTVKNQFTNKDIDDRRNTSVRLSLDYEFDDGSMILFNTDHITIDDSRLNLGAISCNRDAFFGCASIGTDVADHLNRPNYESGSIQAVLQQNFMLRTNISDDNYATTDANRTNSIDTVNKNFDPIRRQDDTFNQFQYIRNLDSQMGDIEMRVKVTDRNRSFTMIDDNDHSQHSTSINNFYSGSAFNTPTTSTNMFSGSDGVYDIESLPFYCVGTQTDVQLTTSSECTVAKGEEQQYELNFISDFDGPFNFVTGFYGYQSEATNQYVVQNVAMAMAQDFSMNPISKIFNGGQDTKGGFLHAATVAAVLGNAAVQGGLTQAAAGGLATVQATAADGTAATNMNLNALVNGLCTYDSAGETSINANGTANTAYGATGTITGIDACTKKLPSQQAGNMIDSRTDRDSLAVYGELYYDLSTDTQVTFGYRYMDDRYTNRTLSSLMDTTYSPRTENALNPDAQAACRSATRYEDCFQYGFSPVSGKDEIATYKFAIKHQYDTDLAEGMVFASYTEGNRPGGANAQTSSKFDNSETESIQIGSKNTFLDGALQLNVTFFEDKQTSAQISEIHVTGSTVMPLDLTHSGVEIQSSFFVSENTIFTLNALLTDSEVDVHGGNDIEGPLGNVIASGSNLLDPHNPTAATSFGTVMNATAFGGYLMTTLGFDAAATSGQTDLGGGNTFNGIIPTAIGTAQVILAAAGFPDVTGDQLYIVDNNGNILVNALGLVLDTGMRVSSGANITYTGQTPMMGSTAGVLQASACQGAAFGNLTSATCTSSNSSASVMQQVGGNKIPGVSDYAYTLGVTHFYEAFNGSGSMTLSYKEEDEVYLDIWNNERYQIGKTDNINANITFAPNTGDWTYNFWVRNLEDNRNITSVNRTSNLQGAASFVTFQEGRKIGLDFKREF